MDDDDDTPCEWSCHSSLYLQQQQQQQQQQDHHHASVPAVVATTVSSSPAASRIRKSTPGAGGAGTKPIVRGPKRPRLGQGPEISSTMGCDIAKGMEIGSNWGICELKHGADEAADSADVGGGARPGCCSFLWSKDNSTSNNNTVNDQRSVHISQSAELQGRQEYGSGSVAGLGGGRIPAHPNGMDVVVGGDRQETGLINDDHGWTIGGGGAGGNEAQGGAGGRAVISSGAGGFPTHPWQQDQGGSSDDMLILYGSPS